MVDKKYGLRSALCTVLVALSIAASGPAMAGKLKAERDWQADGNGNYVHRNTGQVISDSQYSDMVAQEMYQKFTARAGFVSGGCVLNSIRR
jgi:hypothetical protein